MLYETTWALTQEGDEYTLDGRLAQTNNTGEKTYVSEIIVTGSLIGDGEANLWKLSIQAPASLGFTLTADGSTTKKNGTAISAMPFSVICLTYQANVPASNCGRQWIITTKKEQMMPRFLILLLFEEEMSMVFGLDGCRRNE